jgi:putative lipoprotein
VRFFLVFTLWTHQPAPRIVVVDSLIPAPRRSARDPWFGRDKLLHFTASMLIQSTAHTVFRARGADFYQASVGAGLVTATAGIGKELWDMQGHGDASLRDLTWDAIGGASGAVLMRQLDHKTP